MTFMIMLQPFWSAVTDAYYKNDFNWIKNAIRRYCHIAIALIILGSFMLIFSEYAYQLWLGKNKIDIPNSVSVWTYIYYCTTMLGAIFGLLRKRYRSIKSTIYQQFNIPFYIFANDNTNVSSPTLGHLFSTNSINYCKFQWDNLSPFTILQNNK